MTVDAAGDLYLALANGNITNAIRFVPADSGTYYGQAMTAGDIYTIAGQQTSGYSGDGGAATSATLNFPRSVTVDAAGRRLHRRLRQRRGPVRAGQLGSYWGQSMTADHIYTIAGNVNAISARRRRPGHRRRARPGPGRPGRGTATW